MSEELVELAPAEPVDIETSDEDVTLKDQVVASAIVASTMVGVATIAFGAAYTVGNIVRPGLKKAWTKAQDFRKNRKENEEVIEDTEE